MNIIAFTGKMEAGKSTATAALALSLSRDHHVDCYAFAEPMKKMAEEFFYFSEASLYTTEGKSWKNSVLGITSREFLQKFGQGMRDLIDPDIWVKLMRIRITHTIDEAKMGKTMTDVIIIDDLRMENEAKMLKDLGATIVKIVRENHKPTSAGIRNHPSEDGIPDSYIDYTILNNGTKARLYRGVVGIAERLGLEHSML